MPPMTYDFFMGQLRLVAVAVIAWLGGSGKLTTADAGALTAIMVPVGLLLGPWLWSVYRNLGMKLVPTDSVAIKPIDGQDIAAQIGDHIKIDNRAYGGAGTAKIVG